MKLFRVERLNCRTHYASKQKVQLTVPSESSSKQVSPVCFFRHAALNPSSSSGTHSHFLESNMRVCSSTSRVVEARRYTDGSSPLCADISDALRTKKFKNSFLKSSTPEVPNLNLQAVFPLFLCRTYSRAKTRAVKPSTGFLQAAVRSQIPTRNLTANTRMYDSTYPGPDPWLLASTRFLLRSRPIRLTNTNQARGPPLSNI